MRHIAFELGRSGAAQALTMTDQHTAPVVRVGPANQVVNIATRFPYRALMQVELSGNVVAALA